MISARNSSSTSDDLRLRSVLVEGTSKILTGFADATSV